VSKLSDLIEMLRRRGDEYEAEARRMTGPADRERLQRTADRYRWFADRVRKLSRRLGPRTSDLRRSFEDVAPIKFVHKPYTADQLLAAVRALGIRC
jgi:hypothetical protein